MLTAESDMLLQGPLCNGIGIGAIELQNYDQSPVAGWSIHTLLLASDGRQQNSPAAVDTQEFAVRGHNRQCTVKLLLQAFLCFERQSML